MTRAAARAVSLVSPDYMIAYRRRTILFPVCRALHRVDITPNGIMTPDCYCYGKDLTVLLIHPITFKPLKMDD